jgi:hypothetical protein
MEKLGLVFYKGWLNYLIQIKKISHFAMLAKLFSEVFKILYFNGENFSRNKFIKCEVELIQFFNTMLVAYKTLTK